ncbi:redoxin domain-containing protein [Ureibacillus manganicus]|uniref:Thiol-disulfide oxidoreductase n=1 Tax=Ureibacillus manganicus DSM 26584 TaxID=1384049 RepID=A0A0A3IAS9_9BACL|nr:redoxin domain-containing protein [Ureibacillus manganicus]KGR80585.1 thiol-disulfide oxidoreductase [Ureibacillus manganicus DSM 26584]
MKKSIIGVIVILGLVAIMLGGYIKNQIEASETVNEKSLVKGYEVDLSKAEYGLKKGQYAPDFTLETLSGEPITLSDLKGKKVLLNFWATWCPPCKKEMPDLQHYYEKFANEENVEIVAVNLTHTERTISTTDVVENVKLFAESYDLTFPIPLMKEDSISKTYQIITIPSTFMIDTEGRIQRQIIGPLNVDSIHEYVRQID